MCFCPEEDVCIKHAIFCKNSLLLLPCCLTTILGVEPMRSMTTRTNYINEYYCSIKYKKESTIVSPWLNNTGINCPCAAVAESIGGSRKMLTTAAGPTTTRPRGAKKRGLQANCQVFGPIHTQPGQIWPKSRIQWEASCTIPPRLLPLLPSL
jgi:hypothetical protein